MIELVKYRARQLVTNKEVQGYCCKIEDRYCIHKEDAFLSFADATADAVCHGVVEVDPETLSLLN